MNFEQLLIDFERGLGLARGDTHGTGAQASSLDARSDVIACKGAGTVPGPDSLPIVELAAASGLAGPWPLVEAIGDPRALDRHRIVIAYDTPSDRRRRKLARCAESYASRVQQSVFEANLDDTQLRLFVRVLASIVDAGEDDVRLYPQCVRCAAARQLIGRAKPATAPSLVVA